VNKSELVQQLAARAAHDLANRADLGAVGQHGGEAFQLVVVELVRVLARRQVGHGHEELGAPQRLGHRPVRDLLETDEQPAGVRADRGHRQVADRTIPEPRGEHGPGTEAFVRCVGVHVDGELAADAVRLGDAPDQEELGRH